MAKSSLFMNHIKALLQAALPKESKARWGLAAAFGVLVLVATALVISQTRQAPPITLEPPGFAVSPQGTEVPRLTPVRVTFPSSPASRGNPEELLRLEPATPGRFTWIGERTLQYQPDFPGLLRGQEYNISVARLPEAGLSDGYRQSFTAEGLLTVQQVIPQSGDTEVPSNAALLIQFSRSVAPLTVLSAQNPASLIQSEPPIQGQGEWLNTSLYRFTPTELQPDTQYQLRIAAGVNSAADGVLQEDYGWSFSTVSPAVSALSPDNQTFVGHREVVSVTFNQPMERASVEAGFQLMLESAGPVPGTFTWAEGDTILTFTPTAPLPLQSQFEVVLPAGIRGARGGQMQAGRRSTFSTVGQPGVGRTDPAAGSTDAGRYGVTISFTNPMDRESLEDAVSVSGVDREKLNFYWSSDTQLRVNVTFTPSTRYTVTLAAGARDRYGQPFSPYSFSFTTGALPSSVSFAVPNPVATFSGSAEPVLYYHAINEQVVTFSLYPLTEDEARSIQRGALRGGLPRFTPSQPALRTWSEEAEGGLNQVVLGSTSLSGGGALSLGDYFVTAGGDFRSVLAFSVVNAALVTKLSFDELMVWALDHDTGIPLRGLEVRVEGSGLQATTARTDDQGLAGFPYDASGLPSRETIIATVDEQRYHGVAIQQWQQGARPYQFNLPFEYQPREYVGHIYTDRPIYRPGEQVQYKGVLRTDDDASYRMPPSDPPLQVVVQDANRKEVLGQDIHPNDFGTFAGTLELPADAATGDWTITIAAPPQSSGFRAPVTSMVFAVAEFRKPEFQVVVKSERDSYVNGESIAVDARASFFFGGPLADAPVRWSALSSPHGFSAPGFPGYSFTDFDYYRPAVVREATRSQGTATTDDAGSAAFTVPATITGNEGPQRYLISATATDQSAQEVSASHTVTVHPAAIYAGIRPGKYVATAGETADIQVATVDTAGEPVPDQAVTVEVYQREWITTKEQTPEGGRRYRSEPRDTRVATLSATTGAGAQASVSYTPQASGSLRLVAVVTDSRGRTSRSAAFLWVSGGEYARWQVTNDDVLQLVPDKDQYRVGEVAEVLVPAPFEGMMGLVTVERGKIISRTTRTFQGNSERLQIPIEDGFIPNVFLSVVLYRPPTETDPVPRYKVGYAKLAVSTEPRALRVEVQPDRPQTRPGEKVRYDIRVTEADGKGVRAELSVAVVDKALLSLAEERAASGLRAFWFERGLGVATASSMAVSVNRTNDVIAEASTGGKGGGLDEERLRQEFRNTAFWEAQLTTGDDGTASVEVAMPDNLTTWRTQVRAVGGDTLVGEGTNELVSTQPLLLRPALPRFLREGDKAALRLLVRNGTGNSADVEVSLDAEGLTVAGDRARRAVIQPAESAIMEWPAEVNGEGVARLTFTAAGSRGLGDALVQELPIHAALTPETTATGGIVTDEPKAEAVYLPAYAQAEGGRLEVALQASLVGALVEEMEALKPVPGEGAERTANRIMAAAGVRRAEPSVRSAEGSASDHEVAQDVARLGAAQQSDGGWAWCSRCPSDPNVTGVVLMALGEARKEGISVSDAAVAQARSYLLNYLDRPQDAAYPLPPAQRAFLLYALARAGAPERGRILALWEQYRDTLSEPGRAYMALALVELEMARNEDPLAQVLNDLSAGAIASANGNHWEDSSVTGGRAGSGNTFPHTSVRTTAVTLLALGRAVPEHALFDATVRWLVVARGSQRWHQGVEQAQAVLALGEYSALRPSDTGGASYRVEMNGREWFSGRFDAAGTAQAARKDLPLTQLLLGRDSILSFLRDFARSGRLFYSLNLRYLTPATDIEALNRGLAISHQYTALEDPSMPVGRVKLGDTVRVKVTVTAPHDLNYVVLEDFLPGGLEPIDPTLKTTDPKLVAQLESERREAASAQTQGGYFAPWYRWYYSPWRHVDTRDDRVSLYADRLPRGVHEYVYYVRATSLGDYFVPPAQGRETYFPEVFGRSDSGRLTIAP